MNELIAWVQSEILLLEQLLAEEQSKPHPKALDQIERALFLSRDRLAVIENRRWN